MNRRFGYCCINMSLSEGKKKSERITTNRSMTKKTFEERGINYASELALQNVSDLGLIISWNNQNGIKLYRMSSDMFPWMSEYELKDLPDYDRICNILKEAGKLAKDNNQRITFHPGHFCVIASANPDVVSKSIKELSQHAEIMDLMELDRSHLYPMNIHVNTTQPCKDEAAKRFCDVFQMLDDSVKSRLVVEVDDKRSQYTSSDLKRMVHDVIGIPITFDYLHNSCNPPENLSEEDSLKLCLSTWPNGIPPLTHFSESRKIFEDSSCKEVAHSDWLHKKIETYNMEFDIELEVKMKDKALLDYHFNIESILWE